MPFSPQVFSWSAYSGLWLPLSLLISWKPSKHSSPFSSASLRIICSALAKTRDLQSWFRRTRSARNVVIHTDKLQVFMPSHCLVWLIKAWKFSFWLFLKVFLFLLSCCSVFTVFLFVSANALSGKVLSCL